MHSHKFYKNRKYIGNIYIGNINIQAKDQLGFLKMQKQSFMRRKKLPKIPSSFFLNWPSTIGHGLFRQYGLYTQ